MRSNARRNLRRAVLGLAILGLAACSHTHQFAPDPNVSEIPQHKLKGRSLALDLSAVPETYSTSANGHNFQITGIRAQSDRIVRKMFASERWVQNPAQADYVLKLTLNMNLGAAMGGTRCDANARWDILQKGRVAASGTASDRASFPVIANGGRNCEIASINAVSRALDAAMAGI